MGILDTLKKSKKEKELPKEQKVEMPAQNEFARVEKKPAEKEVAKNKEVQQTKERTSHNKKVSSFHVGAVLIRPLITEKGSYLGSQNQYVFEVADTANKIEIKKAIMHAYGVKPLRVRTMRKKGKSIRTGRVRGTQKLRKKALVTLQKGETIEVYKGV